MERQRDKKIARDIDRHRYMQIFVILKICYT